MLLEDFEKGDMIWLKPLKLKHWAQIPQRKKRIGKTLFKSFKIIKARNNSTLDQVVVLEEMKCVQILNVFILKVESIEPIDSMGRGWRKKQEVKDDYGFWTEMILRW